MQFYLGDDLLYPKCSERRKPEKKMLTMVETGQGQREVEAKMEVTF